MSHEVLLVMMVVFEMLHLLTVLVVVFVPGVLKLVVVVLRHIDSPEVTAESRIQAAMPVWKSRDMLKVLVHMLFVLWMVVVMVMAEERSGRHSIVTLTWPEDRSGWRVVVLMIDETLV